MGKEGNQAAAFAATCNIHEPKTQLLARAEAAGRKILTYVKLSEAYPSTVSGLVKASADKLVETTDPDTLDAVWIVCGAKPLQDWSPEVRAALPEQVSDISSQLLIHGLELKFRQERDNIVKALQLAFPGGPNRDAYFETVDACWSNLSRSAFWKAHLTLQRGTLPTQAQGLTFEHLLSSEFWVAANEILASSSALCVHHEAPASTAENPDSIEFEARLLAAAVNAKKTQAAPVTYATSTPSYTPATTYAAPTTSYVQPAATYAAPTTTYAAPATSYAAPATMRQRYSQVHDHSHYFR